MPFSTFSFTHSTITALHITSFVMFFLHVSTEFIKSLVFHWFPSSRVHTNVTCDAVEVNKSSIHLLSQHLSYSCRHFGLRFSPMSSCDS